MVLNKEQSTVNVDASLQDLGVRLAKIRLSRNLTQARLAEEAGTSLPSIKRLEAGKNSSLDTYLRVLRALNLGDRLVDTLPNPAVRPVERVKNAGHERQRARSRTEVLKATDWAWGKEEP